MQKPNFSPAAFSTPTSASPPRSLIYSGNPFLSPTSPDNHLESSNESFFAFRNYSPSSFSDTASLDGDCVHSESSFILEYQQLFNAQTICLAQLEDAIERVDALRRENESLRLSNADLSHRVALLFSRDRLLSEFSRLNIASPSSAAAPPPVRVPSPQSLITEHNRFDRRNTDRVSLPKSISVRSRGYRKTTRPSQDATQPNSLQKVCVPKPGTKKEEEEEEEALELDVYNQGMLKTELCNKWQETGTCPYSDTCQFAHGINELRPVIRHPRYKTEVCRMVLAGDICPYGHRCHFRHSLTEQERLSATSPASR